MFPSLYDHLQLSGTKIVIPAVLKAGGELELLQLFLKTGPFEFRNTGLEPPIEHLEARYVCSNRIVKEYTRGRLSLAI